MKNLFNILKDSVTNSLLPPIGGLFLCALCTHHMGLFRSYGNDNRGYSHGSIDVITAINLFFKFLLISPILLLAMYVAITMMKHVIFHGIPSMNKPTEEQQQRLREADAQIGMHPQQTQVEPVVTTAVETAPPVKSTLVVQPRSQTAPYQTAPYQTTTTNTSLRKYCTQIWLPKYGNNPNADNSACNKYRTSGPVLSPRLRSALDNVN